MSSGPSNSSNSRSTELAMTAEQQQQFAAVRVCFEDKEPQHALTIDRIGTDVEELLSSRRSASLVEVELGSRASDGAGADGAIHTSSLALSSSAAPESTAACIVNVQATTIVEGSEDETSDEEDVDGREQARRQPGGDEPEFDSKFGAATIADAHTQAALAIKHAIDESNKGQSNGQHAYYQRVSALAPAAALRLLRSQATGLPADIREIRSLIFGPNSLAHRGPPKWYVQLGQCFLHPFNILLSVLAIISIATGDPQSLAVLLTMITISVTINFTQERRAIISAQALLKRITHNARIRRPIAASAASAPVGAAAVSHTARTTGAVESESGVPPQVTEVSLSSDGASHGSKLRDASSTPHHGESASAPAQLRAQTKATEAFRSRSSRAYVEEDVAAASLVPGDLVLLSAGCLVPADVRLISVSSLLINQTNLTGESMPVEKSCAGYASKVVPLENSKPDSATAPAPFAASAAMEESEGLESSTVETPWLRRSNLAFLGSVVECGSGVGLVIATGENTYFGANSRELERERPPSAFSKGVKQVSYVLMGFTAVMLPVVIIIHGLMNGDWAEAGLFGAAVAVGITPHMLPMIVSGNLSLSAHRLAQRKCLVKRLAAVQNLGASTVLCTDKTGTLTVDHISLSDVLSPNGEKSRHAKAVAYVISTLQEGFRNVLDAAIVSAVEQEGAICMPPESSYNRVHEQPFDFRRRRMSIVVDFQPLQPGVQAPGPQPISLAALNSAGTPVRILLCKGALTEILSVCSSYRPSDASSDILPMDAAVRHAIEELGKSVAQQGFRVVAVASKVISEYTPESKYSVVSECDLTLLGILTFLDAPKESAGSAIHSLAELGVRTKVLTGDNPLISRQVCGQLKLKCSDEYVMTGADLARLPYLDDDPELHAIVQRVVIFCQLTPDDKARVVHILSLAGETVVALADGVNDALMLRQADVGVSVDTGADLAKEAADIILVEKDLNVLAEAVKIGRTTHGNSIKYIKMAASSNYGNCFSMIVAAAWLPFLPMAPLQILIQNLLYDISQLAIPFDHMDADWLAVPQKWSGSNLMSFMFFVGPTSSVFDITTWLIAYFGFGYQGKREGDSPEDQDRADTEIRRFQTMWFMTGVMTQTLIVHMIRTQRIPFVQSRANPKVIFMTILMTSIALALPYMPIADAFGMEAPPVIYFAFLAAIMFTYTMLVLAVKKVYIWKFRMWL